MRHPNQVDGACGFILRGAVHPHAIEDEMVRGTISLDDCERGNWLISTTRDLKPDEAIVICAGIEEDRPDGFARAKLDPCQDILG